MALSSPPVRASGDERHATAEGPHHAREQAHPDRQGHGLASAQQAAEAGRRPGGIRPGGRLPASGPRAARPRRRHPTGCRGPGARGRACSRHPGEEGGAAEEGGAEEAPSPQAPLRPARPRPRRPAPAKAAPAESARARGRPDDSQEVTGAPDRRSSAAAAARRQQRRQPDGDARRASSRSGRTSRRGRPPSWREVRAELESRRRRGCAPRSPSPRTTSPTCCATPATARATTRPTRAPRPSSASRRSRWPTTPARCSTRPSTRSSGSTTGPTASARPAATRSARLRLQAVPACDPVHVMQAEAGAPLIPSPAGRVTDAVPPSPSTPPGRPARTRRRCSPCSRRSGRRLRRRPADQGVGGRGSAAGAAAAPARRGCCTLDLIRNPGAAFSHRHRLHVGPHARRLRRRRGASWPPAGRLGSLRRGRGPSASCSAARSATSPTGSSAPPGPGRGHVVDFIAAAALADLQPRRLGHRARRPC